MKLQNYKISKNLIEYLLESKVHLGLINFFIKNDLYFYLYGFRNKVCIFNLYSIHNFLKKLFYLFINILKNDKKIIFIFSPIFFKKHFSFLTMLSKNKYIFLENNREDNMLYLIKNCNKIGLIFLFHNTDNSYIVNFVKSVKIPLTGFTSNTIKYFDYPIVGNFQSLKSILYLYRLLFYILNLFLLLKKKFNKKNNLLLIRKKFEFKKVKTKGIFKEIVSTLKFKFIKNNKQSMYKSGGKVIKGFKPYPHYSGFTIRPNFIQVWDSKKKVLRTFKSNKYKLKSGFIEVWDTFNNKWYIYNIKKKY